MIMCDKRELTITKEKWYPNKKKYLKCGAMVDVGHALIIDLIIVYHLISCFLFFLGTGPF